MVERAFSYIWSYRVSAENTEEFVDLYSPGGSWAALFGRGDGYLDTRLYQDAGDMERFVTIDRWESERAFALFRERFAEEFEKLDRQGEALTSAERFLGEFQEVGESG